MNQYKNNIKKGPILSDTLMIKVYFAIQELSPAFLHSQLQSRLESSKQHIKH